MQFISRVINQICGLLCNSNVEAITIIIIIEAAGAELLHFMILLRMFGNYRYEGNTLVERSYIGHIQTV